MFEMLEKNIVDMIEEQQLKLGYLAETVRLYYPLSSLNRFVGRDCTEAEMEKCLNEFAVEVRGRLGQLQVSNRGKRFCIAIPPEGAAYVHEHMDTHGFLASFVEVIGTHGTTLEEVLSVFRAYSDGVHIEKVDNNEFDYLVYFENGMPDDYRYCITEEGNHIIYHRYTREDYEEFGF